MIVFEPGDIVVRRRKSYEGPFKYLMTRIILFFTTEWWKGESASRHYHAEMVYGYSEKDSEYRSITMEPPRCRIDSMPTNRIIVFRLRFKPSYFDQEFSRYCNEKMGLKYDFIKFLMCGFDWVFHTTWFTRTYVNPCRDICSEFVARFYEERINIPCSRLPADATKPDDIYDACMENLWFFIVADIHGK